MAAVILVLSLFCVLAQADHYGRNYNDMQSAYNHIFSGYNKNVLPKMESGVPVNVSIDFTIIQLDEVNEDDGEVGVVVWLGQHWSDPRLAWEPDFYHGTNKLSVPRDEIWRPDLAVYNSVRAPEDLNVNNAIVFSSGAVTYIPAVRMRATCPIDENSKNVTCTFKVGSWVYNDATVAVYPSSHMSVKELYTNPHWDIEFVRGTRELKTYECCPEAYSSVIFSVRFVKNP